MRTARNTSGFIQLGTLFATALLMVTSVFTTLEHRFITSPSPAPTVTPSPEPSPTNTPLPSPSPSPSPTPRPSQTPKPNSAPVSTTPIESGPPGSGFSRVTVSTDRGTFSADVLSIPTTGLKMVTDTASDSDCSADCPTIPLTDYITRDGAFAGMNGTYFCPTDYADCAAKKNSFDFPIYNSRLHKWINEGNLFWNNRAMIYQDGSGFHFVHDANSFHGGLNAGIVNFPGLIDNGNIVVDEYQITDKQKQKGPKAGIGLRGDSLYIIVVHNADMYDTAAVFKNLGMTYGLNLDGGGSTALWYGGYKDGPGRNLPNAVLFTR